jgi:flagellar assembly protein FliH
MSVVTRGRVLRAGSYDGAALPALESPEGVRRLSPSLDPRGRRVPAAEVEAHLSAQRVLEDANREAEDIRRAARQEAASIAERAADEAQRTEHAKVAALYLALVSENERRAERDLDRSVALAVLLAERLLGQALEERPELVAGLARQALAEARGARRATIEANPLDAGALERHLVDVGMQQGAFDIRANPELSRGSLRVHTNLGTLDAKLTPQLERLAKALRDALEP